MPLGYEMLTLQHGVSGEIQELYYADAMEYLSHPWFSKYYYIYNPGGYGISDYGVEPYGNE